jgi:hypothetical protein
MGAGRSRHTATPLFATSLIGKVLVAGGLNPGGPLRSAELYDPRSGTWSPTASLNGARQLHTATLLGNDDVLAAGGSDLNYLASAELYVSVFKPGKGPPCP